MSFRHVYGAPYLSWAGRTSRSRFNAALLGLFAAFAILFVFIEATFGRPQTLAIYPFFGWGLLVLATRRLHDRGRSMMWLAVLLIPLAGPLWMLIELCCRAGSDGENQYGEDPLGGQGEYLTVVSPR